jgi:hypothetical protein
LNPPPVPMPGTEGGGITSTKASRNACITALDLLPISIRAALAAYCFAYGLWAEATEAIQRYGAIVKSPTGYPI